MKRLLSIVMALLVVTGSGVMLSAEPANAQGSNGYVVSPVREELTIEKGQSQTITLTVENATQVATTAAAIVNDFEASQDESGQPRILLDGSAASGNSFKTLIGELPNVELGALEKSN